MKTAEHQTQHFSVLPGPHKAASTKAASVPGAHPPLEPPRLWPKERSEFPDLFLLCYQFLSQNPLRMCWLGDCLCPTWKRGWEREGLGWSFAFLPLPPGFIKWLILRIESSNAVSPKGKTNICDWTKQIQNFPSSRESKPIIAQIITISVKTSKENLDSLSHGDLNVRDHRKWP